MASRMPIVRQTSQVVKESEKLENWLLANFQYLRLCLADLNGIALGRLITVQHAVGVLRNGVTTYAGIAALSPHSEVPANALKKFVEYGHPNAICKPDPDTIHAIPWADVKEDGSGSRAVRVAEVMCHLQMRDRRLVDVSSPEYMCPRFILLNLIKRLDQEFGLTVKSAFDPEFILINKDEQGSVNQPARLMSNVMTSEYHPLMFRIEQNLRQAGVDLQGFHANYSAGQLHLTLAPVEGIKSADQMFILKQGVHEMANQNGKTASFMSKRSPSESNSAHFRFSLHDKNTGENILEDDSASDGISDKARHVLAGLVQHCGSLLPLYAPTVNCYRRFSEKFTASHADWDVDSRQVAFRIKVDTPSGASIENRLPGGLANPYLVMAGTLAACMEGLSGKLQCPPASSSDAKAAVLPKNLKEALQLLETDTAIAKALGGDFAQTFVNFRKELDLAHFEGSDIANMSQKDICEEIEYYEALM